jgi:hypothetical protein
MGERPWEWKSNCTGAGQGAQARQKRAMDNGSGVPKTRAAGSGVAAAETVSANLRAWWQFLGGGF